MAYTINKISHVPGIPVVGEMLSSGCTRYQVLNELKRLELMPDDRSLVRQLPRFGKVLIVCGPALRSGGFCIVHR